MPSTTLFRHLAHTNLSQDGLDNHKNLPQETIHEVNTFRQSKWLPPTLGLEKPAATATSPTVLGDVTRVEAPVTLKAYVVCVFTVFGGIFFGYDPYHQGIWHAG